MAAGLVVPVSGPYTGTWDGYALGTQNDDGFVLMGSYQGQEVNQSDAFGMTLVEAIYRGLNWKMRFRGLEFNSLGIRASLHTFGATGNPINTLTPTLESIGSRYTAFSKVLVLTAILGNPPCSPQTLTANSAVVSPQSNVEYLMTSKVREAPFEMVLLPYDTGDDKVSFTTT